MQNTAPQQTAPNVPQLRFSEFKDEWNKKELKEVSWFWNGSAHEQNISANGRYIVINSKFISTNGKVKKHSKDQISPLKRGDIAIVMSDIPKGSALAKCFLVDKDGAYTLNQRIGGINSDEIISQFLVKILNRNRFLLKIDNGVSQTNLRKNEILKCPVVFPAATEQKKIADFLGAVDLWIENLRKQKLELEKYKKGMMQKIFSQEIRFKEDEGNNYPDWNVKKMSDIFERITRKNKNNNKNVLTISAQQGLINQENYFNKSVSALSLIGYYLLYKGEFAYNKSYSKGYPMGAIKKLDKYNKGVVSTLYICFKVKDNSNSEDFFKHLFDNGTLNRQIRNIAQEGARAHGLLNLSATDFFEDIKVFVPTIDEQQKIADFLSSIDNLIESKQKQIDKAELWKKGLMQSMFV
ncbi:hypothetical protein A3A75_00085 [Candidatus Woesebacteria bacterium RIFCSPLOWO2_01_FULL_39_10]|uniref:Type I restriction modification DNA specificity domain-containing protein n=1 Tax=Candidatus Woesebacteria bacterium RIFCSPLOWO2_01_FULL_39_10 TaxID=1802516 RepID=A0A1F8B7I0_9BACT|nr:MAG: hypothetical protein A3A75_00085 [Candidatus Woesebacteria bacterium RIFCSPLOWO2_01_FULL_39_10]